MVAFQVVPYWSVIVCVLARKHRCRSSAWTDRVVRDSGRHSRPERLAVTGHQPGRPSKRSALRVVGVVRYDRKPMDPVVRLFNSPVIQGMALRCKPSRRRTTTSIRRRSALI